MRLQEHLSDSPGKRTKCLVYTRVMGYHRPIESFNIGKKGEHKQRLHYTEPNEIRHNQDITGTPI